MLRANQFFSARVSPLNFIQLLGNVAWKTIFILQLCHYPILGFRVSLILSAFSYTHTGIAQRNIYLMVSILIRLLNIISCHFDHFATLITFWLTYLAATEFPSTPVRASILFISAAPSWLSRNNHGSAIRLQIHMYYFVFSWSLWVWINIIATGKCYTGELVFIFKRPLRTKKVQK